MDKFIAAALLTFLHAHAEGKQVHMLPQGAAEWRDKTTNSYKKFPLIDLIYYTL